MAQTNDDLALDPDEFYFIPMGGSEQFGVNFNLYSSQGKWLAIDCGIGFADHRLPGVDILLPDPTFLAERKDDLAGLVITHAHEDHIGAVPHLWPRLRCPVYCTPFTAAVLRRKLQEVPESRDMEIHEITPGQGVDIDPFKLRFIHVAHSIPESCAVVLDTPEGCVIHSGDWNLDPTPVIGSPTDSDAFKAIGKEGVLAYIGDSTNSTVDGRAGSEADVEKGLLEVFKSCKGRIAVTCFSSGIARIQSICRAAEACGRTVAPVGRSLHNMIGAAKECGYLNDLRPLVSDDVLDDLPADQQVLIVTGSQGEARAALARIARGEFSNVRLNKGDTVIFSARPIPGNEKDIDEVKNNLVAAGVQVIGADDTEHTIHVSGHPCRDEVTDMFGWVRPEVVVPVHGERQQLEAQAALARKCQVGQTIVPHNGSVVRLKKGASEIIDHVETGVLAMDAGRLVGADHAAIRERRKLQYTGAAHVTVVLDKRGDLAGEVLVSTLGVIDPDDEEEAQLEEDLVLEVEDILADMQRADRQSDHAVHEEIRIGVRRHINLVRRMKPRTTVHVIRV